MATARHGTGDAQEICRGLAHCASVNGARWMRLGVVKGNARAERFWLAQGYVQPRTWDGVVMGKLTNTVRTMIKPLTGEAQETYLTLVPRDRPVFSAED